MTSRKSKRAGGDDPHWLQFWFWAQPYCSSITELMRNYPELQVHFELFDRKLI